MQNELFDEFEAIYKLSERKIGGSYGEKILILNLLIIICTFSWM